MTIERAKAIYDAARRAGELKAVVTENGATEIALGHWGAP